MITVIVTPRKFRSIAEALLPQTCRVVTSLDCDYRFYSTDNDMPLRYAASDGDVLIETRTFDTEAQADVWVSTQRQEGHK